MTPDLIKKSFQTTGVWPMDAQVILKRFNKHPQQQDETPEIGQHGDGDSWRELRKIFDVAGGDKSKVEARGLRLHFGLYRFKTSFSTTRTSISIAPSTPNQTPRRRAKHWTFNSARSITAGQYSGP
jgi:hypothetical protein